MITARRGRPLTDARHVRGARTLGGAFRLFLCFPSPRILALSLGAWTALRFWADRLDLVDAAIALGVASTWPLLEWSLHVVVLHFRPRTILRLRIDPIAARVHRWHHKNPWIVEGIFLPAQALAVLTPLALLGWWWACDSLGHALTGMATLTATTILYEWTHFLVHVPYAPKTAYARRIKRNHQLHHFKNERYWHAFTVPAIDTILGTGPDPATVERSLTVRNLGVDGDAHDGEPS